jgi:hypothetical protein
MNTPSKDDIIAQILEIMARHNLSLADIEEPENQQEPERAWLASGVPYESHA